MSIDAVSLFFILSSCILWLFIYCPIIIYHLRKYQSRDTNIVYLLRYSNITVIQSILLIIKLICSAFSAVSSFHIFGRDTLEDDIVNAITAYLAAFFLYCFVWKFWLLRYNIMLNNIVINCEWKAIINHTQNKQASNTFYAKYRETFGSTYFVGFICLIIAIIFTTMYVITHIIYPQFYGNSKDTNTHLRELYAGWDYAIPFILLIIIYIKTPAFNDNFYITKEMKYIFICLCVQYFVYYSWLLIMSGIEIKNALIADIILFIEFQIIVAVQFIAMLISTSWVNQRCQNIIKTHRYEIHKISNKLQLGLKQKHCIEIQPKKKIVRILQESDDHTATLDLSESYPSNTANVNLNHSFRDDLYQMLSSTIYYNEFIKHLSKEFSVECLLSLTEFVQFRDYMISIHGTPARRNSDSQKNDIKLATNIPESFIVQNKQFANKEKAWKLYAKYIKNGAEFEINISSEERSKYNKLMGNYPTFIENKSVTDKKLTNLFVPCCNQMIYLMIDSKKRFQDTPIFQKLTSFHQK